MKNTELSLFGQLALQLDQDFAGLERLSGQIERLDIGTDNGLEHGLKLLSQFAAHGESISAGIQSFAKALDDARTRSEHAATIVSQRAEEIQLRAMEQSQLQEKFNQLGAKVQVVNAGLLQMKQPVIAGLSPEERAELNEKLKEMDVHLGVFVDEAAKLKDEASAANLKKIERNAESLHGTLISARSKLSTVFASH